jgi:hypothetical protein
VNETRLSAIVNSEPDKGKHGNPTQDADADEEPDTDRERYLIDGPFDQQQIAFQLAQAVWEIKTGSFSAMESIDDSKVLLRLHVLQHISNTLATNL